MSRYRGREVDDVALWMNYVDVPLGAEKETSYWPKVVCPNPGHDTTKKHFQVNVQDGLVHCFAQCGISGTYEHAIKLIEECDDRQARRIILASAGRKVGNSRRRASRSTENQDHPSLDYDSFIPQSGMEYLDRRQISAASISRFGIGWCPETLRIVIPARDRRGQARFLIKRAVRESQRPKYLYSADSSRSSLLFAAFDLSADSDYAVVVEGCLDAIRLSQHGIPAVATLGTGISIAQVRILARLRPRKVYLMLDKDASGVHGIEIAEKRLRGKYPLYICRYPKGRSDPAELTKREAEWSLERAIPLRKFKWKVRQT